MRKMLGRMESPRGGARACDAHARDVAPAARRPCRGQCCRRRRAVGFPCARVSWKATL